MKQECIIQLRDGLYVSEGPYLAIMPPTTSKRSDARVFPSRFSADCVFEHIVARYGVNYPHALITRPNKMLG